MEKSVQGVVGGKIVGVGVHQSFIPLTGKPKKEAACIHKLRFIVKICMIVASKELAEFELKGRKLWKTRMNSMIVPPPTALSAAPKTDCTESCITGRAVV